jgi:putative chitinase
MITELQLKEITGIKDLNVLSGLTQSINDTLIKYQINTPLRVSHFLAQVLHESGNLKFTKENLNYSSIGLTKTFNKYFLTEEVAKPYARQPNKIANKVYANRMGNGDEASGDGGKFIGRGYIQLTGRDNYTAISKSLGVDFIAKPELLETVKYAALSAGWFWDKNKLNTLADADDVLSVTKRVNGGTHGLDDRKAKLAKLKTIIK